MSIGIDSIGVESIGIEQTASGGATTHATTGTLTGQGATVAGTSAHIAKHATTGALVGQGATVSGSSTRYRQFASTGSLIGQGAAIVGSAARAGAAVHATTGALTGQGATVSGTSAHIAKHATTGVLTGQGSSVVGTAANIKIHATSGVLVGAGSNVVGIAVNGTVVVSEQTQVGVGNGPAKRRGRPKKQHVWLVEVDDKEYEVDDLEEVAPIVAKKIAKGKTPVVKAKPLVDNPRKVAEVYTQQPWLTQYVPIPAYEKRMGFVDVLPYIVAMQEMEDEEDIFMQLAA